MNYTNEESKKQISVVLTQFFVCMFAFRYFEYLFNKKDTSLKHLLCYS